MKGLKAFATSQTIIFIFAHYLAFAFGFTWGSVDFGHVITATSGVGLMVSFGVALAVHETRGR